MNLRELRCRSGCTEQQVDVVSVVFQTTSVGFSTVAVTDVQRAVLIISTFGAGDRTTDTEAFVIISDRSANAVAVLTQSTTTVVGHAFAVYATVFTTVLNSKVQAVNQTKEVSVTVGREAVTTLLHEVVRTVGVTTEFWQYVGPEVTS